MPRIIVIDDEVEIAKILCEFLQKKQYEVVSFSDPQQALLCLDKDHDFDLLITDLKMPKIRGLDILKYIKDKGINIPSIVLTGSINAEEFKDEFETFGLMMDDVVYKPIDLGELLKIVELKLTGK